MCFDLFSWLRTETYLSSLQIKRPYANGYDIMVYHLKLVMKVCCEIGFIRVAFFGSVHAKICSNILLVNYGL